MRERNKIPETDPQILRGDVAPELKPAKKKGKFKRSGHLTDQILKYNYPKLKQPSLFDSLDKATKEEIEVAGIEREEIAEGIKLTPAETKVIDSLCKLLHENSYNESPKDPAYYTGNLTPEIVEYKKERTPAPKLAFTIYELAKEYKGGEAVSGKDLENVSNVLHELSKKQFLLRYKEETIKKGGGKIVKELEMFQKIIELPLFRMREYSKEGVEVSKTEETVVILHPVFRRQIDSKFLLYPNDITKRTAIAYGSHNISEVTLRLRDYLMREHSSKRYDPEIKLDRLYYQLAEKWMNESRKKKVKEYTDKALETVIALGLLESYEIKTASNGEPKIVFHLNKNWE